MSLSASRVRARRLPEWKPPAKVATTALAEARNDFVFECRLPEVGLEPAANLRVGATVRRVDVPDADAAEAQRFLGSPTIRVNGRDIEPGVAERDQYVLSCRIYRTEDGFRGQPDEQWLREALTAAE